MSTFKNFLPVASTSPAILFIDQMSSLTGCPSSSVLHARNRHVTPRSLGFCRPSTNDCDMQTRWKNNFAVLTEIGLQAGQVCCPTFWMNLQVLLRTARSCCRAMPSWREGVDSSCSLVNIQLCRPGGILPRVALNTN